MENCNFGTEVAYVRKWELHHPDDILLFCRQVGAVGRSRKHHSKLGIQIYLL